MDLLERAAGLDELDGPLAATTGGRVVQLAGEAASKASNSASRGRVWRALLHLVIPRHADVATTCFRSDRQGEVIECVIAVTWRVCADGLVTL